MNFFVIPGRGIAANPEPMHTDGCRVSAGVGALFQETVFMGSGPSPVGCPGMTPEWLHA
jgi:hypothetical protein